MFNVITGDGETAGAALVAHPKVAHRVAHRRGATGKASSEAAADTLKRVHLELGGKAPVVVFDDADLEAVVAGVAFGYCNSGQDCTAATPGARRPGITTTSWPVWPTRPSLVVGDPATLAPSSGPVISAEQRERVAGFVDRAVAAGATVVTGGHARRPAPASSTSRRSSPAPTQDSEIIQREVFGPVVTVQRFTDEAEAIAWANGVDYGLAASVWTAMSAGRCASERAAVRDVWVNDHGPLVSEMPHGGFKQSGVGKDMSVYAIEAYTELKHVMIKTA